MAMQSMLRRLLRRDKDSQTFNTYIHGGQGGPGGEGHIHGTGGDGGPGQGPTVNYDIRAQQIIMNNQFTGSAVVHSASQIVDHHPLIVNNCPPPSRIFQGRQDILERMQKYFKQVLGTQHIYVLYGLGGAGKTQIGLKFIEESSHFVDKFLIDSSTPKTIDVGLKGIATTKKIGDSAQDALKWLASNHNEWLLFFDNADDPKINLNKFFPKCNHGNIVVTSRNPGLRVYGASSQVADMQEADAVVLLLKSAALELSETNQLVAAEIVKVLCYYHPGNTPLKSG
ncbi:hypothetical protein B0H14DRAFT_2879106 [Mycena olivaceomarginata]|nr:hypothetical protein B0H14DRAFT_2879106 [Mycena olivaceomarginata]